MVKTVWLLNIADGGAIAILAVRSGEVGCQLHDLWPVLNMPLASRSCGEPMRSFQLRFPCSRQTASPTPSVH